MKETHKKQGTKHRTNRGREVFRKKNRKETLSLKKKKQTRKDTLKKTRKKILKKKEVFV